VRPQNAIRGLALLVAVKEFIKKITAMISACTNKMGQGVWFKSIQHKNRHFNTKTFVPFKGSIKTKNAE